MWLRYLGEVLNVCYCLEVVEVFGNMGIVVMSVWFGCVLCVEVECEWVGIVVECWSKI